MKVCIAGKNNIAVEIVSFLIEKELVSKNEIYIVLNKTDNYTDTWQRSLGKYAKENELEIVSLDQVYDIEDLLFLSLEFDKIIKVEKFKTNKLYNIHFSILPKYKGMFTSILPILNNEPLSGVTLHKIDKGIDTGDIIATKEFSINKNDNSRNLYFKYLKAGIELLKDNFQRLEENIYINAMPQVAMSSQYYSKDIIDFSNIIIDLNQVAINIHNQVRAFYFREYQIPKVFDYNIISSEILCSKSKKRVGSIILENSISFLVSTIDYDIVLYKDRGDTLFEACANGNLSLVNELIQIPNIINIQNQIGWTPLIVAIYNNEIEIVKTLLINGADIQLTNFKGTTPLMYAKTSYCKSKDSTILKILLALDVDIYQQDYQDKNVLDYTRENSELDVLELIMEAR
ncbi:MAG: Methionyl-tRNA formyltransferase (EC [uncultured Sulfurovum sp.]|uniref:Methionyl-tRNA formyltransferase (EC) n=1 Tax=uncultured Sulfurovum sp. TaxID=269237 RepID=A0A6S6TQX2_9BACT|nr:MAG: Methionyl-tRNA formyltransferase (EC [uncultured Sulfurovum sp.]